MCSSKHQCSAERIAYTYLLIVKEEKQQLAIIEKRKATEKVIPIQETKTRQNYILYALYCLQAEIGLKLDNLIILLEATLRHLIRMRGTDSIIVVNWYPFAASKQIP